VNGDGQQTRDFVFVDDVVQHLLAGMDRLQHKPEASVFNVCTGRATSIVGLAETLGEITGWMPAMAFSPRRAGDIQSSLGSPTAARLALRVGPSTSLTDGLGVLLTSAPPALQMAI
jgi:UDP-glucose 4-epimerase